MISIEMLIANLIPSLPPTVAAVFAYLAARTNAKKIDEVHVIINERLSRWLATERGMGKEEGRLAGKEEGRAAEVLRRHDAEVDKK